jgi:hypothetical protein
LFGTTVKGKPNESWGRKVTGLKEAEIRLSTTAGPPESQTVVPLRQAGFSGWLDVVQRASSGKEAGNGDDGT